MIESQQLNSMENILRDISVLINKHTGLKNTQFERSTRLYEDLKIDGDDAFELLKEFEKQYKIDMRDFKFNEYFSPEGIDVIGAIISWFKKRKKLKELTVGDIEQAIITGKFTNH
jgi:acyl carrier protein